jgi:putative hydrolase of the HAD superfamily
LLQILRPSGVQVALVSNCIANTRPLVSDLGISALAEVVVLSCEAGFAEPDPRIYQQSLDQLGVSPGAAVFIEDQPAYRAAATTVGMTALPIARSHAELLPPPPDSQVIGSLLEAALIA